MFDRNDVQFPRLLAEIRAVGLTPEQIQGLCASMDLTAEQLETLLERAEIQFERNKDQGADLANKMVVPFAGFETVLTRTDEGLVVDICNPASGEVVASTYTFEGE